MKKILWLFLSLFLLQTAQGQVKLTEKEKIQILIKYIRSSENITFLRNGDEHNAEEAANHIESKWEWLEDEIKTAKDFIEKAASKSSISGKKYQVRLADGTTLSNSEFLLNKLKKIESN